MNMNGNKLLDKISDLDPKLIEGAEKKTHRSKRGLFVGLTSGMATVAAAAVIAVTAANARVQQQPVVITSDPVVSGSTSTQDPPVIDNTPKDPPALDFSKYKDLPKISDNDYSSIAKGGVEKSFLSQAELETVSPWKGAELETMPVYMSNSTDPDLDKMYDRVKQIAELLGISADSLEISDNYDDALINIERHRELMKEWGMTDDEIERELERMIRTTMSNTVVSAKTDGIDITMGTAFNTYITFDESFIPEGYNFSNDATAEEKAEILNFLADKYKDLLQYSKPVPASTYKTMQFSLCDSDCDLAQQIVNYWINHTDFASENKIQIYSTGSCEKLGDYPILTAAQAEEILKSNKYDDNRRMPANAKILKTDIQYLNLAGSTAVMPYYKFYVEANDEPHSGDEIECDVYTIAAVPEEFIDMETADYSNRA